MKEQYVCGNNRGFGVGDWEGWGLEVDGIKVPYTIFQTTARFNTYISIRLEMIMGDIRDLEGYKGILMD